MLSAGDITCTCLEPSPVSDVAAKNAQELIKMGAIVKFGIDATKLQQEFGRQRFDKVGFFFTFITIKGVRRLFCQKTLKLPHIIYCHKISAIVIAMYVHH